MGARLLFTECQVPKLENPHLEPSAVKTGSEKDHPKTLNRGGNVEKEQDIFMVLECFPQNPY